MHSRKIFISVAGIVLFLLAGAMAMFFLPPKPDNQPAQKSQPKPEEKPQPVVQEKPSEPAMMFVYVTGEVNRQGVYKFPKGSRIYQAIDAAGGFKKTADSAALNLADLLEDKMHIHVDALGSRSTPKPSPRGVSVPGMANSSSSGGLINVNTATAQELQALKGIGPALSKRIVEYRQTHGAFSSPEDLVNVKGIGPATLSKFRSQITVR